MIIRYMLIFSSLLSASANALVVGGTNFSNHLMGSAYPSFDKIEPYPPFRIDRYSLSSYEADVQFFVLEVKEYLENSDNDIKRIKEEQEDVVKKANRVVDEYNNFINNLKRKKY